MLPHTLVACLFPDELLKVRVEALYTAVAMADAAEG